jgi:hypothetical protein
VESTSRENMSIGARASAGDRGRLKNSYEEGKPCVKIAAWIRKTSGRIPAQPGSLFYSYWS